MGTASVHEKDDRKGNLCYDSDGRAAWLILNPDSNSSAGPHNREQGTPLKRGGDSCPHRLPLEQAVSIHSTPQKGWRQVGMDARPAKPRSFNPLHPSKGVETQRFPFVEIEISFQSTPPLKRGGDRFPALLLFRLRSFNPLHPSKGVETSDLEASEISEFVSIHSTPQKGWRRPYRWFRRQPGTRFNPLHPSKGVETMV